MSLYVHWPLDLSVHALKAVAESLETFYPAAVMQSPEVQVELQNIANEARAMLQQVAAGARKTERRTDPPEYVPLSTAEVASALGLDDLLK